MPKILQALLVIATLLILHGCNTIAGIGKDIGIAGDKIEASAKKQKKQ